MNGSHFVYISPVLGTVILALRRLAHSCLTKLIQKTGSLVDPRFYSPHPPSPWNGALASLSQGQTTQPGDGDVVLRTWAPYMRPNSVKALSKLLKFSGQMWGCQQRQTSCVLSSLCCIEPATYQLGEACLFLSPLPPLQVGGPVSHPPGKSLRGLGTKK